MRPKADRMASLSLSHTLVVLCLLSRQTRERERGNLDAECRQATRQLKNVGIISPPVTPTEKNLAKKVVENVCGVTVECA